jgi:hypothetical protein
MQDFFIGVKISELYSVLKDIICEKWQKGLISGVGMKFIFFFGIYKFLSVHILDLWYHAKAFVGRFGGDEKISGK